MKLLNISKPTNPQIVHGIERTLIIFILAVAGYFKLTPDPWTTAAWSAAGWAGIAAVYQFLLSLLTSL